MQRFQLIFVIFFILINGISAQSISYGNGVVIRKYTQENGLSQNSIRDLVIDQNNFCWIASEMGVTRFDGKSFKNYSSDLMDSVSSNRFVLFSKTSKGLYVTNLDYQTLKINVDDKNIIPAPKRFAEGLFLGNNGKFINPAKTKLHPFVKNTISSYSNETPVYSSTFVESDSSGYFYSGNNLIYFKGKDYSIISNKAELSGEYDFYEGNKYFLIKNTGYELYIDGKLVKSGIKIPNINNSFYKVNKESLETDYIIQSRHLSPNYYVDSLNNIYEIKITVDNNVYLEKIFDRLPIKLINVIHFDKENDQYFIGTSAAGLYIVKKSLFLNLADDAVLDGAIYYQYQYNDTTIFTKNLLISKKKTYVFPYDSFRDLRYSFKCQDKYYAVTSKAILKINSLEGNVPETVYNFDYYVSNAHYDSSNHILNVFSVNGWLELNIPELTVKKQVLFENKFIIYGFTSILKDTFLCYTNKGLKWYDRKSNHFFKTILPSSIIRSAYYSSPDNLWVTTYGNGFFLYRKGVLVRLPDGPRNALKSAHAIFNDNKGHFWITTNNGLYKVKIKELLDYALGKSENVYYYLFDRSDGIITTEFNGGIIPKSYLLMPDSTLSLPSMQGVIWFNPFKTKVCVPKAPIFISEIYYNNKIYRGDPFDIQLNYGDAKQIKIKIVSPYFGNPLNIALEYSINDDPIYFEINQDGFITFNNMAYGEHSITVKKKGINSDDSTHRLSFRIHIKPPFYRTALFYGLMAACLLLIIIFIVKRRIKSLKAESEKLEQVVKERTMTLSETIKSLEISEKALEEGNNLRENIIAMILHDLRSPLRFLTTISNDLYKKFDYDDREIYRKKLFDLKVNTFSILNYSENFFTWANSQRDGFTINETSFNLSKLFYDIDEFYTDISKQNKNRLIIEYPEFEIRSDYNILSLIVRNLIDNANKNTQNGIISLKSYCVNNSVIIEISDTGKGLSEQEKEMFTNVITQKLNSGFGNVLILSLLPLIKGKLKVESTLNVGTVFIIKLG
ncbi:sensor histidine kinase [Polluticaenibacter yanchengensis]|uniref:ATP-binding protein n=1 Tax=Polluticaenibacter yanchengensis TaxID=3014562 RepID=A0ABT4UNV4_9BACT|nr:ATP-binding protein [Chitinophagaceae bacterium LY-5]